MGLNSIQLHVKDLLDAMAIPAYDVPLTAWIEPPPVEDADGPRAYVWGGRMSGARQTMPRGMGFMQDIWTIDVYVNYMDTANNPNIDQQFPLLIDAVLAALRADVMPVFLIDPTTGVRTQMLAIGEKYDVEYPPVRLPGNLQMLWSGARISVEVKEALQA